MWNANIQYCYDIKNIYFILSKWKNDNNKMISDEWRSTRNENLWLSHIRAKGNSMYVLQCQYQMESLSLWCRHIYAKPIIFLCWTKSKNLIIINHNSFMNSRQHSLTEKVAWNRRLNANEWMGIEWQIN